MRARSSCPTPSCPVDDAGWSAHLVHVRDPDGELAVIRLDVDLCWPQPREAPETETLEGVQ